MLVYSIKKARLLSPKPCSSLINSFIHFGFSTHPISSFSCVAEPETGEKIERERQSKQNSSIVHMEITSRPHYQEIIMREDRHHVAAAAAAASASSSHHHFPPHQQQHQHTPAPAASSSSSSSTTTGTPPHPQFPVQFHHQQQIQSPTFRSDPNNNPYPTTFVTADTSSFKQVVQMLTGSDSPKSTTPTADHHHHHHHHYPPPHSPSSTNYSPSSTSTKNFVIPPIRTAHNKKPHQQQQSSSSGFKLYERRNSLLKSSLIISPLTPHNNTNNFAQQFSPRNGCAATKPAEILSPSNLNFPSLTLSPVTTLVGAAAGEPDHCNSDRSSTTEDEEVRAIAEKGFYFLPSPRDQGVQGSPQLLPLFPVTSPRVNDHHHQQQQQQPPPPPSPPPRSS